MPWTSGTARSWRRTAGTAQAAPAQPGLERGVLRLLSRSQNSVELRVCGRIRRHLLGRKAADGRRRGGDSGGAIRRDRGLQSRLRGLHLRLQRLIGGCVRDENGSRAGLLRAREIQQSGQASDDISRDLRRCGRGRRGGGSACRLPAHQSRAERGQHGRLEDGSFH